MLRKIIEIKRYEITGGCGKLYSEKRHDFYSSVNIIRVSKSRRMKLSGNVARMERKIMLIGFESQKERNR
jgi:hypothetical protein